MQSLCVISCVDKTLYKDSGDLGNDDFVKAKTILS